MPLPLSRASLASLCLQQLIQSLSYRTPSGQPSHVCKWGKKPSSKISVRPNARPRVPYFSHSFLSLSSVSVVTRLVVPSTIHDTGSENTWSQHLLPHSLPIFSLGFCLIEEKMVISFMTRESEGASTASQAVSDKTAGPPCQSEPHNPLRIFSSSPTGDAQ